MEQTFELGDLFPPSDPAAIAMFRLAYLRGDLMFELVQFADRVEVRGDPTWAPMYFSKRITVTLVAIRDAFRHPTLQKFLKQLGVEGKPVREMIDRFVVDVDSTLESVRHSVGAHSQHRDFEAWLRDHSDVTGSIKWGKRVIDRDLRLPYMVPILASLGADLSQPPGERPLKVAADVTERCADAAVDIIDHVLKTFWGTLGISVDEP